MESLKPDNNNINEWHDKNILKKIGNVTWPESLFNLHKNRKIDIHSKYYKRLAYDEILSHLLVLSEIRKRVKKLKKNNKIFNSEFSYKIIKNFKFTLTDDQKKVIDEINNDVGYTPSLINARFLKPFDSICLNDICANHENIITIEEGS